MNPTINYLKKRFQDYYLAYEIVYPPNFLKREWGFRFFDGVFKRHLFFNSKEELREYIIYMIPRDIYYSGAIYENGQWAGADLLFDIDSGAIVDLLKLLYVLKNDFGVYYTVQFSGRRGFHVIINDKKSRLLDSWGRREIADYILAKKINIDPTVTTPTNHLIRCGGSLNGKTGLRAVVFKNGFDLWMFNWAMAVVFTDREIFISHGGDIVSIEEWRAIRMMLNGTATIC